jgi:hypothetical protein
MGNAIELLIIFLEDSNDERDVSSDGEDEGFK